MNQIFCFIAINNMNLITSHLLNRTHGWKLTSSKSRGFMNDNERSGIPVSFMLQSILKKTTTKIVQIKCLNYYIFMNTIIILNTFQFL